MFPHINHVSEVQAAIKGLESFKVKVDEEYGYKVINYVVNSSETFPRINTEDPVENLRRMILRECRGIKFDLKTGKVICRPYHKFFNVGEREETFIQNIDLTAPHRYLIKLDGSMINPFPTEKGTKWGTKMGVTDVAGPAERFATSRENYVEFALYCIERELTPSFEWCSRQQKIVIDYAVEDMVLTAVRDNYYGVYMKYEDLVALGAKFSINVVKAFEATAQNIEELTTIVRSLRGEEGIVIRKDDGEMYKMKADEYVLFHKTLDSLKFEKDVLNLVLTDKIDDALPLLKDDVAENLRKYNDKVLGGLRELTTKLWRIALAGHDNTNGSKKRFAIEVMNTKENQKFSSLLFSMFDLIDNEQDESKAFDFVKQFVLKNTNTFSKVDATRHLWGGVRWHAIDLIDG